MILQIAAAAIVGTIAGCSLIQSMKSEDSPAPAASTETYSATFGYPSLEPGQGTRQVSANSILACISSVRGSVPAALCLHLMPTAPPKTVKSPAGTMSIVEGDHRKNYEIGEGELEDAWVLVSHVCLNAGYTWNGVSCQAPAAPTYTATFTTPSVPANAVCSGPTYHAETMASCLRDSDALSVALTFCAGQTSTYENRSPAGTRTATLPHATSANEVCAENDTNWVLDVSSVVCDAGYSQMPDGSCDRVTSISGNLEESQAMCALTELGSTYCWGSIINGESSYGTRELNTSRDIFKLADSITYKALSMGQMSCVIDEDNGSRCVGYRYNETTSNTDRLFGAPYSDAAAATPLPSGVMAHDFKQIDVGDATAAACGVYHDGRVFCWGFGGTNLLAQGDGASREIPVQVAITNAEKVEVGLRVACALKTDGDLQCWGVNPAAMGRSLGYLWTFGTNYAPASVDGGRVWKDFSVSRNAVCAIDDADDMYCWGMPTNRHNSQRLNHSDTPLLVAGGVKFNRVFISEAEETAFQVCGISTANDGYCWAYTQSGPGRNMNQMGAFGDGTLLQADGTASTVPLTVTGGHKFAEITVGSGTKTCGLTTGHDVYCWGNNSFGHMLIRDGGSISDQGDYHTPQRVLFRAP